MRTLKLFVLAFFAAALIVSQVPVRIAGSQLGPRLRKRRYPRDPAPLTATI